MKDQSDWSIPARARHCSTPQQHTVDTRMKTSLFMRKSHADAPLDAHAHQNNLILSWLRFFVGFSLVPLAFPSPCFVAAMGNASTTISARIDDMKERLTCSLCRGTLAEGELVFHRCAKCAKNLCVSCMPARHTVHVPPADSAVAASDSKADVTDDSAIARAVSRTRGTDMWLCPTCVAEGLNLRFVVELPDIHPEHVAEPAIAPSARCHELPELPNVFRFNLAKRICAISQLVYDKELSLAVPAGWNVDITSMFSSYERGGMFGFVAVGDAVTWGTEIAGPAGVDAARPVILVAFRGTCTLGNVLTDLDVKTQRLPAGMLPVDFDLSRTGLKPPAVRWGCSVFYYVGVSVCTQGKYGFSGTTVAPTRLV